MNIVTYANRCARYTNITGAAVVCILRDVLHFTKCEKKLTVCCIGDSGDQ
jgi:hypothetical protein